MVRFAVLSMGNYGWCVWVGISKKGLRKQTFFLAQGQA
jgi:hypothetical protein